MQRDHPARLQRARPDRPEDVIRVHGGEHGGVHPVTGGQDRDDMATTVLAMLGGHGSEKDPPEA